MNENNLRICSWNIEGLFKYKDDLDLATYIKDFQICAFSETWGKCESQFENFIQGYTNFSKTRKRLKTSGRYSGGITVFVDSRLTENTTIKRIFPEFEDCVCLLMKGDYLGFTNDIILCFAYISPEGSPIYDLPASQINGVELFEDKILSNIVASYPDASIFLAGDFNSRTSCLQDFITKDNIDLIMGTDAYYESDDFDLKRNSKDKCTNSYDMSFLQMCKTYAIHIFNGRLHQDQKGHFTCIANDGASIVDYMVGSTCLFNICSFL
ncbi:MAG: endonuclease/exonuclease/phosphatase family protein [Candidatus Thiodiazotropha endolucinida]|nr:endonuclease/exonuclease/phosphatase family protein [Candidatus Thiodiazotropha taylori]MCW4264795.1 endonuclease/exonuclease/phosphatase family protein [Candidatus Thiodiazotropha endolucinida]